MNKETNRLVVFSVTLFAIAIFYCAILSYEDTSETSENALESYETIDPLSLEYMGADVGIDNLEEIVDVSVTEIEEPEVLTVVDDLESIEKFYTDEDAIALAQMVWGEARGVKELWTWHGVVSSECQQAATIWTVLNRYDAGFGDSIIEVVSAPDQYLGYNSSYPVDDEILSLTYDVLDRWNAEKNGETDVGRVLPSDYLWFRGDGKHNHFRNEYDTKKTWKWELGDPYMP